MTPTAMTAAGPADLSGVTTAALKAELAEGLRLTAERLAHLGRVWAELERRGEDLSALAGGVGKWVARIAAGELLPELVVEYCDRPATLARVAALPVDRQQQVAAGAEPPPPTAPRPRSPAVRAHYHADGGPPVAVPGVAAAAKASPRDLAESILAMIEAAGDPADVARRLLPTVERLARGGGR